MRSRIEIALPAQEAMLSISCQDLINFLRDKHEYYPLTRMDQKKLYSGEPEHVIVTLNNISTLVNELKHSELDDFKERFYNENDPTYSEKYSLRYLVTPNMQILFAKEGQLSKSIPGHRHMADTCLAAGNIFFSKDYSRFTLITHDSGDFKPNANSLLWPLIILSLCSAASCPALDTGYITIKLSEHIENLETTLVHHTQETLSKALITKFTPVSEEIKEHIIAVNASAEKIACPTITVEPQEEVDFVYCTPPSTPKKNRVPSEISVMLKNFIDLTRAVMASEMLVQAVACPQLPNQAGALQYLGLFATEQPAKKHKSQTALPPESVIGSNVMNHPTH
jgi:hypothetical protein